MKIWTLGGFWNGGMSTIVVQISTSILSLHVAGSRVKNVSLDSPDGIMMASLSSLWKPIFNTKYIHVDRIGHTGNGVWVGPSHPRRQRKLDQWLKSMKACGKNDDNCVNHGQALSIKEHAY